MRVRYRDNMTPGERAALLAELAAIDQCYADADAAAAALPVGDDEDEECFDPPRDGWVDRNTGRP